MAAPETIDEVKKTILCDHRNLGRKWMQNAPSKVRQHRQKTQPWMYCRACKKFASRLPDSTVNAVTDSLRGLENYFNGFSLIDKSSMTEPKSSFDSVTSSLSLPLDTAESAISLSDMLTSRDIMSYTDDFPHIDDFPELWIEMPANNSWSTPQYAFPYSDDVSGPLFDPDSEPDFQLDTMHEEDSDNDPPTVVMGSLRLDGASQADGVAGAFHRFPVLDYDESVPEFVLDDSGCGAINAGEEEIRNEKDDAKNPTTPARQMSCDLM